MITYTSKYTGEQIEAALDLATNRPQPDLTQNDPTAADYVKGRTHWVDFKFKEITWDGNTDGREEVHDSGMGFCKVSDNVIPLEHCIGATITLSTGASVVVEEDGWKTLNSDISIVHESVVIVTAPSEISGLTFPSAGVYFGYYKHQSSLAEATDDTIFVRSLKACKTFHKIDEMYIPATIHRCSQVYDNQTLISKSIELEWDGNINGRDYFIHNAFYYYKMSDIAPNYDNVLGFSTEGSDGTNITTKVEGTNCYKLGSAIVVTKEGMCDLPAGDTVLSFYATAGIYFFYNKNTRVHQTSMLLSYRERCDAIKLRSANKLWLLSVDDDGTLTATTAEATYPI